MIVGQLVFAAPPLQSFTWLKQQQWIWGENPAWARIPGKKDLLSFLFFSLSFDLVSSSMVADKSFIPARALYTISLLHIDGKEKKHLLKRSSFIVRKKHWSISITDVWPDFVADVLICVYSLNKAKICCFGYGHVAFKSLDKGLSKYMEILLNW